MGLLTAGSSCWGGGGMLDIKREQKKGAPYIYALCPFLSLSFPTLLHCFMLLSSAIGVQQCCWWWSRVDKGVEWQVVVGGDDLATDGCQNWNNLSRIPYYIFPDGVMTLLMWVPPYHSSARVQLTLLTWALIHPYTQYRI